MSYPPFTSGLRPCGRPAPERHGGARARPRRPATSPMIKYQVYALQNGLRVILAEDHRLPLVAVNLWYHVGPANEEPGRTGFAHLFEHMMFQGSKHVPPNAHFEMLEAAGASDINGTTDFDRTNYFETRAVESARAGAVARVGSHGLPARHARPRRSSRTSRTSCATSGGRASRTSRTASSKRPGSTSLFPKGHPYYAERHRLARRHPGREARRRASVLQAVLRAEQRQPRHRRRHRHGARRRRSSRSTSDR